MLFIRLRQGGKNNMRFRLSICLPIIISSLSLVSLRNDKDVKVNDLTNGKLDTPLVDKTKLYGICDLSFEEYDWRSAEEKIDYHESHLLMKHLGVTSVRFWTQFYYFMSGPTTLKDASKYRELRDMYEDLMETNPGVTVIGMNHSNYLNGNMSNSKKPRRDLTPNSSYIHWLEDYEQSWYTLVTIFSEIEYWEIDNEINNNDFMRPNDDGENFTLQEKAQISADMLFYASRGIHHANKNAKTISGGIIVFDYSQPVQFVECLYDEIANNTWGTTNPDDFFEIFGVHPYINNGATSFSKATFTSTMNSIYNKLSEREGGDKKVYCTEVGFNDYRYDESTHSYNGEVKSGDCIKDMYEAAYDLPYIESLCYYKMYDNEKNNYNRYGLFRDPINLRTYDKPVDGGSASTFIPPSLASPKPGAFKLQSLTGGTGDLYSYSKKIKY